jgi:hypothetical protein
MKSEMRDTAADMSRKPKRRVRDEDDAQSAFKALERVIELTETASEPESIVPPVRRRKARKSVAKKATPRSRRRR